MHNLKFTGLVLAAGLAFAGAAHAEDFKLGVTGPMTGPNAAFGAQLQNGTQQAVDDLNKKGGILGEKITVEVGDRRVGSEAGRLGRQQVRRRWREVCRRTVQLGRGDSVLRRLPRKQHLDDHAVGDQPDADREGHE